MVTPTRISIAVLSMPPSVLLFHELAHVKFLLSADEATIEPLVIQQENILRAANGMPLCASHEGACFTEANARGRCGVNPNRLPTQQQPIETTDRPCVVTTAATGGANSPGVTFFRSLRDNVLKRTRWGRAFLTRVKDHYYHFGPLGGRIHGGR